MHLPTTAIQFLDAPPYLLKISKLSDQNTRKRPLFFGRAVRCKNTKSSEQQLLACLPYYIYMDLLGDIGNADQLTSTREENKVLLSKVRTRCSLIYLLYLLKYNMFADLCTYVTVSPILSFTLNLIN